VCLLRSTSQGPEGDPGPFSGDPVHCDAEGDLALRTDTERNGSNLFELCSGK